MKAEKTPDIAWLMADGRMVDAALRKAVREALWRHERLGVPIAIWRNGKVVRVPPNKIRQAQKRRRSLRPSRSRRRR